MADVTEYLGIPSRKHPWIVTRGSPLVCAERYSMPCGVVECPPQGALAKRHLQDVRADDGDHGFSANCSTAGHVPSWVLHYGRISVNGSCCCSPGNDVSNLSEDGPSSGPSSGTCALEASSRLAHCKALLLSALAPPPPAQSAPMAPQPQARKVQPEMQQRQRAAPAPPPPVQSQPSSGPNRQQPEAPDRMAPSNTVSRQSMDQGPPGDFAGVGIFFQVARVLPGT
eukprot:1147333-Rhodomonas_salina.1